MKKLWMAIIAIAAMAVTSQAALVDADAHVRGGTRADRNYGAVEDLRLKDDNVLGGANQKTVLIRFDTTGDDYSTAAGINLSLYISQASTLEGFNGTVSLYGVSSATAQGLALQNFVEGTGLGGSGDVGGPGVTYNTLFNGQTFFTTGTTGTGQIDDSLAGGFLFDGEATDTDGVATPLATRDFAVPNYTEGDNWNFSTAAMLAFAQANSGDNALTFLMVRTSNVTSQNVSFASKENFPVDGLAGPALSVMEP